MSAPIKQIVANCGLDGSVVAMKVEENKDDNFGFNALTHEYGNMMAMGVIVPTKVERVALYGLEDGKVFDFISRRTEAGGQEANFLAQLFRGLGTFIPN